MRIIAAASVHAFTATGVFWAFLAIDAVFRESYYETFVWLAVACFVDMVDGTLARMARVKEVLPNFDGALLDNIIDYITFVLIPALFLYKTELLPEGTRLWAAAAICLASTYQFCREDAKTADHYFTGFPSYWNIVALYLFLLELNPAVNLAIVAVLVVLVFVPIRYVYPSRTVEFRTLNVATNVAWSLILVVVLFQFPDPSLELVYLSLVYVVFYFAISIYLTVRRLTRAA